MEQLSLCILWGHDLGDEVLTPSRISCLAHDLVAHAELGAHSFHSLGKCLIQALPLRASRMRAQKGPQGAQDGSPSHGPSWPRDPEVWIERNALQARVYASCLSRPWV